MTVTQATALAHWDAFLGSVLVALAVTWVALLILLGLGRLLTSAWALLSIRMTAHRGLRELQALLDQPSRAPSAEDRRVWRGRGPPETPGQSAPDR